MSSGQRLIASGLPAPTANRKRELAPAQSNAIRNAFICSFIFAVCFWIVWPVADLPFFDEWS